MTREDLLVGNAKIAEQFGKDVKAYCPDVKHIVVIFNPADITGLITLLYAGLKPSQVTTLPLSTAHACAASLPSSSTSRPTRSSTAALTADTASRWPFMPPLQRSTASL